MHSRGARPFSLDDKGGEDFEDLGLPSSPKGGRLLAL